MKKNSSIVVVLMLMAGSAFSQNHIENWWRTILTTELELGKPFYLESGQKAVFGNFSIRFVTIDEWWVNPDGSFGGSSTRFSFELSDGYKQTHFGFDDRLGVDVPNEYFFEWKGYQITILNISWKTELKVARTEMETKAGVATFVQDESEFWAENFIAEVFYGNRTRRSPTVYLPKPTVWSIWRVRENFNSDILWQFNRELLEYVVRNFGTGDIAAMIAYYFEHPLNTRAWDNNAPILQQPQFRNVIFLNCDEFYDRFETWCGGWYWLDAPKEKRRQLEHRLFSRPFFVNNGEFAFVVETDYLVEYGQTFRQSFLSADILVLYQRIDGKWREVNRAVVSSGHL